MKKISEPVAGDQPAVPTSEDLSGIRSNRYGRAGLWCAFAVVVVICVQQLGINAERLAESVPRAGRVAERLWPPQIESYPDIGRAVVESLQMAIVGTVFGVVMSLLLAFLAARNTTLSPLLGYLVKGIAGLVRTVPALVWALLFIMAVGLGPTAGILALAVNSTGMLVKAYAETIEEIPQGPIEALRSAGATRLQIGLQGIIPAIVRTFIAWSVFRLDINIRYSSILGIVGAGGIGWELARASFAGRYDVAFGVTLVIFAMVMLAESASQWLRGRFDGDAQVGKRGAFE